MQPSEHAEISLGPRNIDLWQCFANQPPRESGKQVQEMLTHCRSTFSRWHAFLRLQAPRSMLSHACRSICCRGTEPARQAQGESWDSLKEGYLGVSQQAVDQVVGEAVEAEAAGGYDGQAAGHGFQDRHAPSLVPGGEQEAVVSPVEAGQLLLSPKQSLRTRTWLALKWSNARTGSAFKGSFGKGYRSEGGWLPFDEA